MEPEERIYQVTLIPEGEDPTQVSERKQFKMETTASDSIDLEEAASRAVVEKRIMDPVSFRDYWEIVSVVEETGLHVVKKNLQSFSITQARRVNDAYGGDYDILTMSSQSPTDGSWVTHAMLVHPKLHEVLERWRVGIQQKYDGNTVVESRHIVEAMIQTAIQSQSNLEEEFEENPAPAHNRIVSLAIKNEKEFDEALRRVLSTTGAHTTGKTQ